MSVFTAGLDLDGLQQTLLKIDLPDGANLTVIDSNGMIVLRFPRPEKFVGKKMLNKPIVEAMLTKKEGAGEGIDFEGLPRLYGYTTIGSGIEAIHISVGIPEQAAYADLKRHMVIYFTLLALVSVLALLGAWLFGKILVISPVNRLIDVTKQLAEGDLTVRTGRSTDTGELGLLASNFDEMAGALQDKESKQKEAEQEVKRLLTMNEMILNSAGEGIYGLDGSGKTTFINPAAAKLLGYEASELIGQIQHTVIHHTRPEGTPFPEEECPTCKAFHDGRIHHVEDEVFWRKDGSSFPVEYTSSPMNDERGEPIGAVVTFSDITARKHNEKTLKESEEKFRQLAENIQEVFWLCTPDLSKMLYISPSYEKVFGRTCESLYQNPMSFMETIHPSDREKVKNGIAEWTIKN